MSAPFSSEAPERGPTVAYHAGSVWTDIVMRSLLVPAVVAALLAAAIVADSQTITVSSPTQSSNGQVVTVTVTGEAALAP